MPRAVYMLGLAIFAQGTSELMLAGLLPDLAADLGVSVPDAGLLISAFAVGMLAGAPVLAVVTLRWPRRTTLLSFLAVFAAGHVAGALTSSYGVLFATRIVAAFVYAGFWAVATISVMDLVPATARGRAMSVVAGGLTVATIVGLPGGTVIGQHLGWRAAFWAVAGLAAVAALGVIATVPRGRPASDGVPPLRDELRAMGNPRLWLAYATTALSTGALLVTFSYLAPLLTEVTGLPARTVPIVLALYGAGALAGVAAGGRFADRRPFATLYVGLGGLVAASMALAVAAGTPSVAVVLAFVLGAAGFAVNPALNTRVFALAGDARTFPAGVNISAFNVGITAGPWLGGLVIDAGLGYGAVGWIGAILAAAALVAVALQRRPERGRLRAGLDGRSAGRSLPPVSSHDRPAPCRP